MRIPVIGLTFRLTLFAGVFLILNGSAFAQSKKPTTAQNSPTRAEARRYMTEIRSMKPVTGVMFHCCSCSVPCPCMFNAHDIPGCNIVHIYHINDGGYVGKDIAGLTAVFLPHPEKLKKPDKNSEIIDSALYIPKGLTDKQHAELMGALIEQSTAMGMGNVVQYPVQIAFKKLADGYEVEIPKIFHVRVEKVLGADEKQTVVDNMKSSEGNKWYIGQSLVHTYQNADEKAWNWSLPKSNGSWTFFSWSAHPDPVMVNIADEDD